MITINNIFEYEVGSKFKIIKGYDKLINKIVIIKEDEERIKFLEFFDNDNTNNNIVLFANSLLLDLQFEQTKIKKYMNFNQAIKMLDSFYTTIYSEIEGKQFSTYTDYELKDQDQFAITTDEILNAKWYILE